MAEEKKQMQAMIFQGRAPLTVEQIAIPEPKADEVLIKVEACAICRTDLHVIDGDLKEPKLPLVPGHEIVGRIVGLGADVAKNGQLKVGQRVGVPWLASTCGKCVFCKSGRENLCDHPKFTGYTRDGGFAQYTTADQDFAFVLPETIDPITFSPMLCAGLIGWRSLRFALPALKLGQGRLGIYGFGAAGHIISQVATAMGYKVLAFVRAGDSEGEKFARSMGAVYAGSSDQPSPQTLDAAIIFATAGELVPLALKNLRRGGALILGGIHMSDVPPLPYDLLWGERCIQSVANLTRADAKEFIDYLAQPGHKITTKVTEFALSQANEAIDKLRHGELKGAAVLKP